MMKKPLAILLAFAFALPMLSASADEIVWADDDGPEDFPEPTVISVSEPEELLSALKNVSDGDYDITLLNDITLTRPLVFTPADVDSSPFVTLKLDGHELIFDLPADDHRIVLEGGAYFYLDVYGPGSIVFGPGEKLARVQSGSLDLNGFTIERERSFIDVGYAGNFSSHWCSLKGISVRSAGSVTISGSRMLVKGDGSSCVTISPAARPAAADEFGDIYVPELYIGSSTLLVSGENSRAAVLTPDCRVSASDSLMIATGKGSVGLLAADDSSYISDCYISGGALALAKDENGIKPAGFTYYADYADDDPVAAEAHAVRVLHPMFSNNDGGMRPVAPGFVDVTPFDWFADDVMQVKSLGLMDGVGNELFGPEMPMTRAMFVTILHRAQGRPAPAAKSSFKDLRADWYKEAVDWAFAEGIVNGNSPEIFDPDRAVTRQEAAAMLARFLKKDADEGAPAYYRDKEDIADWAMTGVQVCNALGLMKGAGGNFMPQSPLTRAQAATVLNRLVAR